MFRREHCDSNNRPSFAEDAGGANERLSDGERRDRHGGSGVLIIMCLSLDL